MKTLKNQLPLFSFILGLALVLTTSAFRTNTAVRYQYDHTDDQDIELAGSWSPITGTEPMCDNEPDLPCVIEVDGPLQDYLDQNNTAAKILESDEFRSSKSFE